MSKPVVLYVGDGCPKCKIAEKAISKDVKVLMAEDNIDKFESHNVNTVPVLELEDGTWVTNFADIMKYLKGEN